MLLFLIVLFMLFITIIVCMFIIDYKKNNQISFLEKKNETLQKENNILDYKLKHSYMELNQKSSEYEKELYNFKKLLKLYGKEIKYIPFMKVVKQTDDGMFCEVHEDYIIPEIHIRFGYGCRSGEYDLEELIKQKEYELEGDDE